MNVLTGIAIFFVVWWIVLFAVLPFGIKRHGDSEPGLEPGAPERPQLWIKAGVTTLIAALVWVMIYLVIDFELIDVRPS